MTRLSRGTRAVTHYCYCGAVDFTQPIVNETGVPTSDPTVSAVKNPRVDRGNRDKDCFICGAGRWLVTYRMTGTKKLIGMSVMALSPAGVGREISAPAGLLRLGGTEPTRASDVGGFGQSHHQVSWWGGDGETSC